MKTNPEILDAYINEMAIYNRWLQKTKKKYEGYGVMSWGDSDYRTIMSWNDAIKMTERVLGLSDEEIAEADALSLRRAKEEGQSEPWNYWVETPV